MAVYVTGDIHNDHSIAKLSSENFPDGNTLTKRDVVIICGDFGIPWGGKDRSVPSGTDKWWMKWLDEKPWTTIFTDGNHENFPLLYSYPVVQKFGGKAHKLNDSIFHMMRGEIFKIQGKTFFFMGGASSHDKEYRTMNVSMWEEELPNDKEYANAMKNLDKHGNKVDYVVTHCLPDGAMDILGTWYERDKLSNFLETVVAQDVEFNQWFCGHFHKDVEIVDSAGKDYQVLYHSILKII